MKLKRVKLKPNSPEFADDHEDDNNSSEHPSCEMPGCGEPAPHRAPKSRGTEDYYHFCIQHVQDYNRAWNFFEGMAPQDIEQHMKENFYGHRPTWKYTGGNGDAEDTIRARAHGFRGFGDDYEQEKSKRQEEEKKENKARIFAQSAETDALAIMGLEPPLDLPKIKKRYKELAKKYHPDLNRDDDTAEEQFKKVNMAYTVLKLAYERYAEKYKDD